MMGFLATIPEMEKEKKSKIDNALVKERNKNKKFSEQVTLLKRQLLFRDIFLGISIAGLIIAIVR